ncbi:MAG: N-6 DNA methylase [Gammaproteobacteria bacterium]|nr:N-6 DNA methylase [Gammaproteobacteria bacterium]
MRDVEGLLPQEAFDELLKYLVYKDCADERHAVSAETAPHTLPGMIRETLTQELASRIPWALQIWPDGHFKVSDRTLMDLDNLFAQIPLRELPIDVRSTALWTFLTPELRKSLGIFTTPEGVVRAMVEVVSPKSTDLILDPACGTGTFLMETLRFLEGQSPTNDPLSVYGVDKNARMLVLAGLNLGSKPGTSFHRACADSLRDFDDLNGVPLNLGQNTVDVILTNPPFGVSVTEDTGIPDLFDAGNPNLRKQQRKVPSEILFVELCLRLLKPGGRLGIVLPRSVITNESLSAQRGAIDRLGHLSDIVDLPSETFASTGTQTTTVAAFFQKHPRSVQKRRVSVRVCHLTNVGFDSTGRPRKGSQLPLLPASLDDPSSAKGVALTVHSDVHPMETLQSAAEFLFRRNGNRSGRVLREFVEISNTGKTPGRAAYTDDGMFILKVGNLTGRGIDWRPRARNFVSSVESISRERNSRLIVHEGDILLTSSAHSARYIAKKVDIVAKIPQDFGRVTFVGELIRIRAAEGVDPYVLLAAIRHPQVRDDLQACVRGQTAHLHPGDLLQVYAPCDLSNPDDYLLEASELMRSEAHLAYRLSSTSVAASELLESTSTTAI